MPPKNKKQLEQQAKRLEQEQKKRQQEERRLQQQRRRYASQTLNTGLILPVSNQLITDFSSQSSAFIKEKIRQNIAKDFPNLTSQKIIKQLQKQITYNIKNGRQLFQLKQNSNFEGNQQIYLKVRLICGFYLLIYLNNHPAISQQVNKKSKQNDQNLLKHEIINHSQSKNQKQQKILNKEDVLILLQYFKSNYFDHFLILHKFSTFQKREDHISHTIHVGSPSVQFNSVSTAWTDLSKNQSDNNQLVKPQGEHLVNIQ